MRSTPLAAPGSSPASTLNEIVETLPALLSDLRRSYDELQERAQYVEEELSRTNAELEERVQELNGLKRHLEAVLQSLPCGVVVRNAHGSIVRVNEAAARILGSNVSALLAGDAGCPAGLQGPMATGEPRQVVLHDGQRRVLVNRYSEVRTADGEISGSVEILDDRTETAALEARLHTADKLAALGTLTAGVAHELRNPLNAVKGYASMLRRDPDSSPRVRRWADRMVRGVDEVDAIIDNMLSLGTQTRLDLEAVDGRDLLESATRLVRSERLDDGTYASIDLEVDPDLPIFRADRIKLRQAIRNLVANALDAQSTAPRVVLRIAHEGADVAIRVCDAGPGVPSELRSRVLDPFFTTRPEGTGMGLPLVAVIARMHGGELELAAEPSSLGGAEFLIRFPLQPADAKPEGSPQPQ